MRQGEPRGEPGWRARALLLASTVGLGIAAAIVPGAPAAAHAVTNTPEMPPGAADVATVDGALLVGWDKEGWVTWVSSKDGIHFSEVRLDSPPKETSEACVPSTPKICYRVDSAVLRIEKSVDGGKRWEEDWQEWPGRNGGWFISPSTDIVPLAIFERDGSYQVYVASGSDGVAVRSPDGTWSMVRDLGAVAAGVMEAPTFGSIGSATVVVALGIAVVLSLLSLMLLSLLARERSDSQESRLAGYGWVAFAEAFAVVLLIVAHPQIVASKPPTASGFELSTATNGLVFAVAAASAVMAFRAGTAIPSRPQERWRIVVSAVLVGVAGGLARLFPWPTNLASPSRPGAVATTAVVALALALALGLWRERRYRAGVRG